MMTHLMASKRVWIGMMFLALLLSASLSYPLYEKHLPQPDRFLYNEKQELIAKAPYTPLQAPPFGSDRLGVPLLYKILEGAKYTIGFAIFVSVFRIIFGAATGILLSMYAKRLKGITKGTSQSFYNIPTIFMAYILIVPVYITLGINDPVPPTQWIIILFQLSVAVGVALPALTVFIMNEVDEHSKQEYIISAQLMGGSKWYIIRTHIRLFLKDKLFILFMQHVVQSMILFAHLGLLQCFIGGTRDVEMDFGEYKSVSLTSEWSGLIGIDRYEYNLAPWIVLGPMFAFAITIFFLNLIAAGVKDAMEKRVIVITKSIKQPKTPYKKHEAFQFAAASVQSKTADS
jgi:peptide/nickel transport system permease protein